MRVLLHLLPPHSPFQPEDTLVKQTLTRPPNKTDAAKDQEHPGDNFQLWIKDHYKDGRWEGFADASFYKTPEGYGQYQALNQKAVANWAKWTQGRCIGYGDF